MQAITTEVIQHGEEQHVRIPAEYHIDTKEVVLRRDPVSGDLVLSQQPLTWQEVFDELDRTNTPDDFLSDRQQGQVETRATL